MDSDVVGTIAITYLDSLRGVYELGSMLAWGIPDTDYDELLDQHGLLFDDVKRTIYVMGRERYEAHFAPGHVCKCEREG